jgi:hypothetical protein
VPIAFPFFVLENLPRAAQEEKNAIIVASRAKYAEPKQRADQQNTDEKSDDDVSRTTGDQGDTKPDGPSDEDPKDAGTGPVTDW